MKTFHSILISGALALSLVGCGEQVSTLALPPAAVPRPADALPPTATAAPLATPAATVPVPVHHSNPMDWRDPFRSPLDDAPPEPPSVAVCDELLCQWDLGQLKLVAVVMGEANPMAMVEDPLGRGFIVRRNTRMGRQGGKVTQIQGDEIVVTEAMMSEQIQYNLVRLHLAREPLASTLYDLSTGRPWKM